MSRLVCLTSLLIIAATVNRAEGQDGRPSPPQQALPDIRNDAAGPADAPNRRSDLGRILSQLKPEPLDLFRAAGIPEDQQGYVLTLERAYALASTLATDPDAARAIREATSEPERFARAVGAAKLARFERYPSLFQSPDSEADGVADPGPLYLEAACQLIAAEVATHYALTLEVAKSLFLEQANAGTISQLQVDQIDINRMQARDQAASLIQGHRDRIDRLKVALGLPPDSSIAIDPETLGGFRRVFDDLHCWQFDPERDFADIHRVLGALPELPSIPIGPLTIAPDPLHELRSQQDPVPSLLREVAMLRPNPGGQEGDREALRMRELTRELFQLYRRDDLSRVSLLMALRQRDQVYRQLQEPPGGPDARFRTRGAVQTLNFIVSGNSIANQERQLLDHWSLIQSRRLALSRALGQKPPDGWDALFASLTASKPGEPAEVPAPGSSKPIRNGGPS